ncbi:GntR family transcriptional regulator [Kribbella antiqua]|uniref:GntR family transcriptional regulator n=1 Tax=Kribbella antiqua TaxID=2512217 RepID=UPI001045E7BB
MDLTKTRRRTIGRDRGRPVSSGSELPYARDLAVSHNVSVGTVSRAIAELKDRGLVEARQYQRARVISRGAGCLLTLNASEAVLSQDGATASSCCLAPHRLDVRPRTVATHPLHRYPPPQRLELTVSGEGK